jgi:erythromycin esterase-like protein
MDPQLSGTAPRHHLVPRLEEALGTPLEASQIRAIEHLFSLDLERTAEERRKDRNAVLALLGRVRQRTGTGSLWARVVEGLLYLDEDHWDYQFEKRATIETEQLRNQQMGQNVSWWLSQDPQAKVIVWAASVHLARTHRGLDSPAATANGYSRENGVSAGQWLADSLGRGYFAIAVSAAAGAYGMANGAWVESVGPADASMLEHAAIGGALQLLPRSELLERGRSVALMLGSGPSTAEWGKLFDAALVLPSERPVATRAGCED